MSKCPNKCGVYTKMSNSFYMYLFSSNLANGNKAIASNLVPFYSALLTHDEWKVAVLHGKISKTWSTIPDVGCIIEHQTEEEDVKSIITLHISNRRLEKVSEMLTKLRAQLTTKLKDLGQTTDQWIKFGGSGATSRRISVQPGVKITFSKSLQELLGLQHDQYDNFMGEAVLSIDIKLDYINTKNFNVLYVMCEDSQGVYANNKIMGILTDITTDSTLTEVGGSIEFTNKNIVYHRWTGGRKTNIQVYFANASGEMLQMNEGYTFVVLHFVKDSY